MQEIYSKITQHIKNIKNTFNTAHNDEKIQATNQEALKIFNEFEKKSLQELKELEWNQEWDKLTIAFYGETNAGKSTLIEALRIYFKEEKKIKENKTFDTYLAEYEQSEKEINAIAQEIQNLHNEIESYQRKIQILSNEIQSNEEKLIILNSEKESYETNLQTLNNETESYKTKTQALQNEIEIYQAKLQELGTIQEKQSQLNALHQELESYKSTQYAQWQQEINALETQTQSLQKGFDRANPNGTEYLTNTIYNNESKLQTLNQELESQQEQLEELEDRGFFFKILSFFGFNNETKILKRQIKKTQKTITALQNTQQDLLKWQDVAQNLHDSATKLSELKQRETSVDTEKYTEKKKEIEKALQEIQTIDEKIAHKKKEIQTRNNTLTDKMDKIYLLNDDIAKKNQEIQATNNTIATKKQEISESSNAIDSIQHNIKTQENRREQLSKKKDTLTQSMQDCEDGAIIGDGRSDFTRDVIAYDISNHGEKIALLDVPGIEGSEAKVLDSINNAVKKAHIIFYIKKDSTPPQKGDNGKMGTLEKIKSQLRSQTEVYTIYNKPIQNPRALKDTLTSEDENNSLKVLDSKMKEILNKNYVGHKTISALVSFYALSTHLAPKSGRIENQQKFLTNSTSQELLDKVNFTSLVDFLSTDIISNTKRKIQHSNLNKALVVVQDFINTNNELINNRFKIALKEFEVLRDKAESSLDEVAKQFIENIESMPKEATKKFKERTRKEVYAYIDTDVSNDEFEQMLERSVEYNIQRLSSDTKDNMQDLTNKFQTKIEEDIERYKEQIEETMQNISRIKLTDSLGFTLNINIDSGIQWFGLLASIGGGVIMFFTPVGWVAMALGIIGALAGVLKSAWGFFDSDYKKEQQRKTTDENLERIAKEIKNDMESQINSNKDKITEPIEAIKESLNAPIDYTQATIHSLQKVNVNLAKIANSIKGELR